MRDSGIKKKYRELLRGPINRKNKQRLTNQSPCIISNNCNGGVIYHDLSLRFLSPTVNLYIAFPDYIHFLERLDYYLALPKEAMTELEVGSFNDSCPCGLLEDIRIAFFHYSTFEDARDKWFERAGRVDMSNLFIMLAQRDGCSEKDVRAFDTLPFEHKVAFVSAPYSDCKCARFYPEFIENGQVRVLTDYVSKTSGRRIIDAYDYVGFLNGEEV